MVVPSTAVTCRVTSVRKVRMYSLSHLPRYLVLRVHHYSPSAGACAPATRPPPSRPSLYTWDTKRPKPHQERKPEEEQPRQTPATHSMQLCHAMQPKPSQVIFTSRPCVRLSKKPKRPRTRERERERERKGNGKPAAASAESQPAAPLTATPISRPAARAPQTAYPAPAWTTTGRRGAPARTGHRPPRRSCAG